MNFSFLSDYYMLYIDGAMITILLSIFTVLMGFILGIGLALLKVSNNSFRFLARGYVEFVRGTPILIQIFIVYYGLPLLGLDLPDFISGVIALSINSSAYISEIIRAGIQAIDRGQMEAARSLGLSKSLAMRYVILPQAFKKILPALGNEFIVIVKESAIVSIIGIHDLMYNTDTIRGNTFQPFKPLIVAAIIYFILTFTLSRGVKLIEKRMTLND